MPRRWVSVWVIVAWTLVVGARLPVAAGALEPGTYDGFALDDLESFRAASQVWNFEIVGHSYLRGPWLANGARGAAFNTVRLCGSVAYAAGYNPWVFGALVIDVSDPARMEPLSFIPARPGTRATYLRVNCERHILVLAHSAHPANPDRPPRGQAVRSGVSFYDVSDPRAPRLLGEWDNPGGYTHGIAMDEGYVYVCGTGPSSKPRHEELHIISYADPTRPQTVSSFHVPGQRLGEVPSRWNQLNPTGTAQWVTCHEIELLGDRAYVAWRDAGVLILDIADRSRPRLVGVFDYTPPFSGDPGIPPGCCPGAHTAMPVPAPPGQRLPTLLVMTDEHFSCPPGFAWVLDISHTDRILPVSTIQLPQVARYDHATGRFVCPVGQQSSHYPWFDPRGHGSLVYITWYDQGLRAFDISNPFSPKEVGYFVPPDFSVPDTPGRHIRESYVDPQTHLIYVTDGNGGGITVLRYTGPIPHTPPVPAAR